MFFENKLSTLLRIIRLVHIVPYTLANLFGDVNRWRKSYALLQDLLLTASWHNDTS